MKKPRLYFLNLFVSMILRMQRGSMQYTHLDDTLFGTSYAIYRMNMKLPCNTLKVRLKFLDTCEQKKKKTGDPSDIFHTYKGDKKQVGRL